MNSQVKNIGIMILITGIIIAVFGWADIQYWLTDLSYENDQLLITIGGLIALVGAGCLIYGLVAKPTIPHPSVRSEVSTHEREVIKEIEVVYCAYCGAKNIARSNYCTNCRAKIH